MTKLNTSEKQNTFFLLNLSAILGIKSNEQTIPSIIAEVKTVVSLTPIKVLTLEFRHVIPIY